MSGPLLIKPEGQSFTDFDSLIMVQDRAGWGEDRMIRLKFIS